MRRLGYAFMAIGGLIGIGFNVWQGVEMTQLGLPTPIWTAIGLALFFVGVFAVMHYRPSETTSNSGQTTVIHTAQPTQHRIMTRTEMGVYHDLCGQMEDVHGYEDRHGIEYDLTHNVHPNLIMTNKCSICGIPRNKKGDTNAHYYR